MQQETEQEDEKELPQTQLGAGVADERLDDAEAVLDDPSATLAQLNGAFVDVTQLMRYPLTDEQQARARSLLTRDV